MVGPRQVCSLVKRERDHLGERWQLVKESPTASSVEVRVREDIKTCQENFDVSLEEEVQEDIEVDPIGIELDQEDTESVGFNIIYKLKKWFLKHKPNRNCVLDLKNILNEEKLNVWPFYKFNCSEKPDIMQVGGGSYMHIGLSKQLKK